MPVKPPLVNGAAPVNAAPLDVTGTITEEDVDGNDAVGAVPVMDDGGLLGGNPVVEPVVEPIVEPDNVPVVDADEGAEAAVADDGLGNVSASAVCATA